MIYTTGLRGAKPFHGIGSPVQAGGRAFVKAGAALRTSQEQSERKGNARSCFCFECCLGYSNSVANKRKQLRAAFFGRPFLFCRNGDSTPRLVLERINDRDVGLDLDRLTVENGGAITPLGHGILRGVQEESIAADHL